MNQKGAISQGLKLASWLQSARPSTIQQMLSTAIQPDMLSFALGLPATDLFPTASYAQAVTQLLSSNPNALQYGPPSQSLKRNIVELMKRRGVTCQQEQILLTSGAQQGMKLLVNLLLEPGETVLLEETIYSGIVQAIEPLQPDILTVPTAETGMDIDAVESILCGPKKPALIYVISDGHNPRGVSLSAEKRQRLVALAKSYRVPLLEDDAYGLLSYQEPTLPALKALDEEWVFYIGSLSKILAPGLRVGWIIVPEGIIPKLEVLKESSDVNTTTFTQHSIAAYLDEGYLTPHLEKIRQEYKKRRDAMLQALHTYFPYGVSWHAPDSGFFIWVEMPSTVYTEELLKLSLEREWVAFVPGQAFCVTNDQQATHAMRLSFSHHNVDQITDGIARLARAYASFVTSQ